MLNWKILPILIIHLKKGNKIIFWGFTSVTDDLGKAEELLMTKRGKKEGTILILKGDV